MTSWGTSGMQTDDFDYSEPVYPYDAYSDNGMPPFPPIHMYLYFSHQIATHNLLNNQTNSNTGAIFVDSFEGMVLSTPSASAKKRRGAANVQPLTIPISPNFATARCVCGKSSPISHNLTVTE